MMVEHVFFPLTWTSIKIKSCDVVIDMFWLTASQTEVLYAKSVCEFCVRVCLFCFYHFYLRVRKCLAKRCEFSFDPCDGGIKVING